MYLILYSPPEIENREPEIIDYGNDKYRRSFPIGYRQKIASCISAYARPLPTIYWQIIDENDQVIEKIEPTHGHIRHAIYKCFYIQPL